MQLKVIDKIVLTSEMTESKRKQTLKEMKALEFTEDFNTKFREV